MGKYRYQEPEKYAEKRQVVLEMFQVYFGGRPEWANERVIRALVKIWNYFENKYPGLRIPARAIPDVGRFKLQAGTYSFVSLIFNRMFLNLRNGIVFQKNGYSTDKNGHEEKGVLGSYNPSNKRILIYEEAIAQGRAIKNLGDKYESEEECFETLCEATIIHELLHMISDDGKSSGFFWLDDETFRDYNEGMTESLACDVAGLRDRHISSHWGKIHTQNKNHLLNSQTFCYTLEAGIMNLVRLSSAHDPDIPYLVGNGWRYDKEGKNRPDQTGSWLVQRLAEAKTAAMKGDMLPYQELQSDLIYDFERNRYMPIIEKIRKGGSPTPNEYKRLIEDFTWIGQNLCITFNKFLTKEEKEFYASQDIQKSRHLLNKMIKNNTIEATPNVVAYLDVLNRVIEIGRDFHQELSDCEEFYRQPR